MERCDACPMRVSCLSKLDRRRKVIASGFYPAFHRGRQRYATSEGRRYMKLQGIWAEGSFAMLKREHKLSMIQKHGILKAKEECLLAAIAVNLKRMAMAMYVLFAQLTLATKIQILRLANPERIYAVSAIA